MTCLSALPQPFSFGSVTSRCEYIQAACWGRSCYYRYTYIRPQAKTPPEFCSTLQGLLSDVSVDTANLYAYIVTNNIYAQCVNALNQRTQCNKTIYVIYWRARVQNTQIAQNFRKTFHENRNLQSELRLSKPQAHCTLLYYDIERTKPNWKWVSSGSICIACIPFNQFTTLQNQFWNCAAVVQAQHDKNE